MNSVQVQRIADLSMELLSCNTILLNSIREYCKNHDLPVPYDPKIEYLIGQALCLIDEINADQPRSDDFLRREQPDGDSTEPLKDGFKYYASFLVIR